MAINAFIAPATRKALLEAANQAIFDASRAAMSGPSHDHLVASMNYAVAADLYELIGHTDAAATAEVADSHARKYANMLIGNICC